MKFIIGMSSLVYVPREWCASPSHPPFLFFGVFTAFVLFSSLPIFLKLTMPWVTNLLIMLPDIDTGSTSLLIMQSCIVSWISLTIHNLQSCIVHTYRSCANLTVLLHRGQATLAYGFPQLVAFSFSRKLL